MLLTAAVFKESTKQLCFSADPVINSQLLGCTVKQKEVQLSIAIQLYSYNTSTGKTYREKPVDIRLPG